jgi:hypothetical protein
MEQGHFKAKTSHLVKHLPFIDPGPSLLCNAWRFPPITTTLSQTNPLHFLQLCFV